MKNIIIVALMLAASVAFVSCGPATPESVGKKFFIAFNKFDMETAKNTALLKVTPFLTSFPERCQGGRRRRTALHRC